MAERIGLSKNVKLEWMNIAADQHLLGKTQMEAMPVIDAKIQESIKCQANVRTIRAILMNMWFKNHDWFLEKATDVTMGISWVKAGSETKHLPSRCIALSSITGISITR